MNTTKSGLRVKTAIKAGGCPARNHNVIVKSGLRVKTAIKAGGCPARNHNVTVRTS